MQSQIKTEGNIRAVTKEIQDCKGRGSVTANMARTVINGIKAVVDISYLKRMTDENVSTYVERLQERVEKGELCTKTTATYISSLNAVINHTNQHIKLDMPKLKTISADEYGLAAGKAGPLMPTMSDTSHDKFCNFLSEKYQKTGKIGYEAARHATKIQRATMTRIREASSIKLLSKEIKLGAKIEINSADGTKSGNTRFFEVTSLEDLTVLKDAQKFMIKNDLKSLITTQTRVEFLNFFNNASKAYKREFKENHLSHGERRAKAQALYKEYRDKGFSEKAALQKVSQILGHGRDDVTRRYIPKS